MKLTAILILTACLQVSAKSYSQRVTVFMNDAPLQKVFKEIQRQTGYNFLYPIELLDKAGKVDVKIENLPLENALLQCLKNTELTFSIVQKTIVIKEKEEVITESYSLQNVQAVMKVSGKVTDENGNPLQGVSVLVKGSSEGASTNANGDFSVDIPDNSLKILVFSFVGMQTQEFAVTNEGPLHIVMKPSLSKLSDVVVIGYGTVNKKDLTGAVDVLKGNDLAKGSPTNIVSAMQGKIAGAVITQSDGAPGAGLNITIRGSNSFLGTQPLYVIDGIPYVMGNDDATPSSVSGGEYASSNAMSFINPDDVESISILKDASATAIYGSRGSNGVVIITTKKGKRGGDKVEFNVNTGKSLVDMQHPHDLFSELSIAYSQVLSKKSDVYLYLGYPGEPALGPVAFMHRPSAMDNPDAPISHHWIDATHITFGVATLGFRYGNFKIEGSSFTGREPDENRYNLDKPLFDSWSGRLSYNPSQNWALQVSHGFIKSPEALHPDEDINRTTASAIYSLPTNNNGTFNATAVWGMNKTKGKDGENAVSLEGEWRKNKLGLYGRYDYVQKNVEELVLDENVYGVDAVFPVNAFTFGFNYDLFKIGKANVAGGGQFSLYHADIGLDNLYGRNPMAFEVFLRLYPGRMKMK